jgi:hypothetical protein
MAPKSFSALAVTLKSTAALMVAAFVLPATANAAEFRVRSQTGYQVNRIEFRRVEYVGQCPGIVVSSGALNGQFISATAPPAPGRRVKIQNVTEGMKNDPYPFTDREYDQGQYSQSFEFGIDDRHRGQAFSVLEGENEFEYEIRENNRIIEQGSFTAEVVINDVGVFPRDTICSEKLECRDENVDCGIDANGDRRIRTRQRCFTTTSCTCPN